MNIFLGYFSQGIKYSYFFGENSYFLATLSLNLVSIGLLAHLVYQPKSLTHASCGVVILCRWHQHWHLCTPPHGTGLDIEASYLVHTCTYVPHMFTSNI